MGKLGSFAEIAGTAKKTRGGGVGLLPTPTHPPAADNGWGRESGSWWWLAHPSRRGLGVALADQAAWYAPARQLGHPPPRVGTTEELDPLSELGAIGNTTLWHLRRLVGPT